MQPTFANTDYAYIPVIIKYKTSTNIAYYMWMVIN